MRIGADRVMLAVEANLGQMTVLHPGSREVHRGDGIFAGITGLPIPTMNGVICIERDPDPGIVAAALDEVVGAGVPDCVFLRPGARAALVDVATSRGMQLGERVPLMVLADPTPPTGAGPDGLAVRRLAPSEVGLHTAVTSVAFEALEELMRQLVPPAQLEREGVRLYLGEVDGVAVSTSMGVAVDDAVGVFDVATLPGHARRGYGEALTWAAVAGGLGDGARWAYLQSSPAGLSVYERMGFETVEVADCWTGGSRG